MAWPIIAGYSFYREIKVPAKGLHMSPIVSPKGEGPPGSCSGLYSNYQCLNYFYTLAELGYRDTSIMGQPGFIIYLYRLPNEGNMSMFKL